MSKSARVIAIEMLTAAEAGKTVQRRAIDTEKWHDFSPCALQPWTDFTGSYEWRVKPEPREVWLSDSGLQWLDGKSTKCETTFGIGSAHEYRDGYRKFREVLD